MSALINRKIRRGLDKVVGTLPLLGRMVMVNGDVETTYC